MKSLLAIAFLAITGACAQQIEQTKAYDSGEKLAHQRCVQEVAAPTLMGCTLIAVPAKFDNDPFGQFVPYATATYGNENQMKILLHSMLVPDGGLPAVMYLHGCAGAAPSSALLVRLARAGFAVIAPNSFYDGRKQECMKQDKRDYVVMRRRVEEVKTVYGAICKLAWIDCSRSALVGFSEGGGVTALFSEDIGFSAFVIGGATCGYKGIRVPASRPVLSVMGQKDATYTDRGWPSQCAKLARQRPNGQHITVPFMGHSAGDHFVAAMLPFLQQHLVPVSFEELKRLRSS